MSQPESPLSHQLVGHYRVIRQIGEGGMGVVYEAVREDIGVRAAVKVLRPEFARNTEIAARFFNEARAANMIAHAGIVKVFDYGHLPTGEAFLAMELLEGESLRNRMEREARLSEVDSMRIARQIAAALASAHSKMIVHRDLKPENIMLVPDAETPGGERIKILDFGIAKLEPAAQGLVRTRTNSMMGTPIYMAPEQCRGLKSIDDRADVYALGVMMFEMLTGQPPFYAEAPGDIIGMHMFKPAPKLSSALPDVDPQLAHMVDAILGKEPSHRPSMSEVAMLLKQLGHFVSSVLPMRAGGTIDLAQSQSGRLKVPQEVQRAFPPRPVPSSTQASPEQDKALAPTVKAPAIHVPKNSAVAEPKASDDEDPLQSIRISPKVMSYTKPDAEPLPSVARPSVKPGVSPGRPEDATAVLQSAAMPGVSVPKADANPLHEVETVPVMRRSAMKQAEDQYLRARAGKGTSPRASGELSTKPTEPRTVVDRIRVEFQARWSVPEQRMGILVFGGLVVLGGILGVLILALGAQ